MILVKTYIDKSDIHGVGVFAAEFISKGTKIWEINRQLDLEWAIEEFIELPREAQLYIQHWGYRDPETLMYRLSFDNDRFMNWSSDPNVIGNSKETFAARDIDKYQELTYPFSEDLFSQFTSS